jgi:hypothetical protein
MLVSWMSFDLGLRGPKPVDVGALKVDAVQWTYLLLGLRDGHPDLLQMMRWGPWHGGGQKQVRGGTAKRIELVRIIPVRPGHETAARVFECVNTFATKTAADEQPRFEYPICQTIERDMPLPEKWLFGLESTARASLFFPPISAQPHLWHQLKRARSTKEVQRATTDIYHWLLAAVPGVRDISEFRIVLCDRAAELFRARDLWNYPRKERPTSDDKRIEFFAKAFAGLMLGKSPATATRKLARWKPPKLWVIEGEIKSVEQQRAISEKETHTRSVDEEK